MVDRVALEMRSTRKRTGGSNPSLSASNSMNQTKVARQLKYSSSELDVDALTVELGGVASHADEVEDDPYDPYTAVNGDADSSR